MKDRWRPLAARNNAEWCDLVCRSHGAATTWSDDAWTSETRTLPFYPDAVTLVPNPPVSALLSRIDAASGCSIKDSFASLDLTDHGFRVLFNGQWIIRVPTVTSPTDTTTRWAMVEDAALLARWEQAWRGDGGPTGTFRSELLDDPTVVVLAGHALDGQIVAGAILNRSATVVGISNMFTGPSADWSGCLAMANALFPSTALVGYESGDQLKLAQHHGFETAGPLRIWICEP